MPSCITPFTVMDKLKGSIPVPCGKCPSCMAKRISGWSFRLMEQSKVSSCASFITLTYDTKHVPITMNGFMDLKKRDVQLFFKRLRKLNERKISYYAVGEYGGKTKRPHYHIILFNAHLPTIQQAWNIGNIHYGELTPASVGYTLKYMTKPGKIPMHRNDDRQKEFSLMSKGLGLNYLSEGMIKWHQADTDNRFYCNLKDGKKISMPRYYKEQIFTEAQRKRAGAIAARKMIEEQDKQIAEKGSYQYWQDKSQSDVAQFRKYQHNNNQGRNKI